MHQTKNILLAALTFNKSVLKLHRGPTKYNYQCGRVNVSPSIGV